MRRATASLVCLMVIAWFAQINRGGVTGAARAICRDFNLATHLPGHAAVRREGPHAGRGEALDRHLSSRRPRHVRRHCDPDALRQHRRGQRQECDGFRAARGFAVVVQDCRGREDSEGEWIPFVHEDEDGYDTIEWAAAQPWSNGKVGMYGGSYLGQTQWRPTGLTPPHLTAIFPVVAYSDFYHNWVYTGGAFQLAFNQRWQAIQMHTRTRQRQYLWFDPPHHLRDLYWHLPLITGDEAAGRVNATYKEWIRHSTYDDYWKSLSMRNKYQNIDVAAYNWGGWFDVFLQGATDNFVGVTKQGKTARARARARRCSSGRGSTRRVAATSVTWTSAQPWILSGSPLWCAGSTTG